MADDQPVKMTSLKFTDVTLILLIYIAILLHVGTGQRIAQSTAERIEQAKQALDYVEYIATSGNCSVGTGNTLTLTFETDNWISFTDPAIRTANLIAMILAAGNNTLKRNTDNWLYEIVRNNVHGRTLIFGSAIALETQVLAPSNRTIFGPYASKTDNGTVTTFDIASAYDYTTNDTEWYSEMRAKDFSEVDVVTDILHDENKTVTIMQQPVANVSHGRWTYPYYDCGGGNIWMVTFSAPILGLNDQGTPVFKGVATIDLELTDIDINQCDVQEGVASGSLDVFRGTHNCQPTTKCVPIVNRGFKRGSYSCECLDGYFFPDSGTAFSGTDIERYYSNVDKQHDSTKFQCTKCERGCDTCVDATPCLFENNYGIRILVLFLVALLVCGCALLSAITFRYRAELVMKTASPIFLQIMICGAVFMCTSVFVLYPEPTSLLCTLSVWLFHMGFSFLYGSLILKTWRISVIFNSRKKVRLPDKVLLQRLLPLPVSMAIYLCCWSLLGQPRVTTIVMTDTKKFFGCSFTYWNYAAFGVEALLLLSGVYLCFTVRKAPAHFNESKHITWSTYNAIILGIFVITLTQFLSQTAGPDVIYVLLLMQLQVFVTITLCLIFVPKLWSLYRGSHDEQSQVGAISVTGRLKTMHNATGSFDMRHVSIQVTPEDFPLPLDTAEVNQGQNAITVLRTSSALRTHRVSPLLVPVMSTPDDSQLCPVILSHKDIAEDKTLS